MPNLIIVSNRLPVSVKKTDGNITVYPSVGGLATGLSQYTKKRGTKWIGWPGIANDDLTKADRSYITKELKKHRCYPVFLTKKQIDTYYNGYSNGVLWPLFHELPYQPRPAREWQAYRAVNKLFADEVLRLSQAGSTIWVHDYQLMLVPKLLRTAGRKDKIGFFLHIPFPAVKKFSELPEGNALLRGILGADLAGFHTRNYTQNFIEACEAGVHITAHENQLLVGERLVTATDFPMGIDYDRFTAATKQRRHIRKVRQLRRKYPGQKILVSVDRLDLTKGLVERLQAYRKLLQEYPRLVGKIRFVMIVAPSRTDIPAYKALEAKLDTLLAEIDTEFARPGWQPVDFIYDTIPLDEVMAYYQMADIAFITPLRDGMNLVAKEFITSKRHNDGVLILSETAGAAQELRDAVLVNPKKPRTMVDGLVEALSMPKKELKRRAKHMNERLKQFSVQQWADSFMETLQKPRQIPSPLSLPTETLNEKLTRKLTEDYHWANHRLILLDYDGVLRAFTVDPANAVPSKDTVRLVKKLCSDPQNDVMIVSGRGRSDLSQWFGDLPLALAAEHGALIRRKGGKNWHHTSSIGTEWKHRIGVLFERYAAETPGAMVEQKEWAVVWHYRGASPYYAQKNLVALRRLLKPLAKEYKLQVLEGNKVLEVRPHDVSKRRAVQEWVIHDHDFVLAIGDDYTDEDMFAALPSTAYTIKVGRGQTQARFRVRSTAEVSELLRKL